tara:strand:+ start:584 stop:841 length:258 start_codon:yes stop_codon:yes gene_type:complete
MSNEKKRKLGVSALSTTASNNMPKKKEKEFEDKSFYEYLDETMNKKPKPKTKDKKDKTKNKGVKINNGGLVLRVLKKGVVRGSNS